MLFPSEIQCLQNDLQIKVDWLSFSFLDVAFNAQSVMRFLGFLESDFTKLEKGSMGYRDMYKLQGYPLFVLSNGSENMGVFVSCSGQSIYPLLSSFKNTLTIDTPFGSAVEVQKIGNDTFIELLIAIRKNGKLSRLDIAIDDIGCSYFTCDHVINLVKSGRCVSKFRNMQILKKNKISDFEELGTTIYMGSRQSEIMLRIYDKRKEIIAKTDNDVGYDWIRWELELKDNRANSVADLIIAKQNLGYIGIGILSNYVRFILSDDERKTRCSIHPVWNKFCENVEPLSIYLKPFPKTIEQKRDWIKQQVMPTLAGVVYADMGAMDIVYDNLESGLERMSKEMKDIVSNALKKD